jgi:hypothetical protein
MVSASRINFPLQLVIVIVASALSAMGSVWAIQAGLRSDIRDIHTQIEGQAETDKVQRELDDERLSRQSEKQQMANDTLRATVDTIQREQRLMQIEFQNFRESVLAIQQGRTR